MGNQTLKAPGDFPPCSQRALERFSIECRKIKTKVSTLANHKEHRQYSEPFKTRSSYM